MKNRYRITKIRNGCFRLEWENGSFSDHSTEGGAVKMAAQIQTMPENTGFNLEAMSRGSQAFIGKSKLGDKNYQSNHSIDVSGHCNMGCC